MTEEHLFLAPELKLDDLADRLGLSPRLLSQVINEGTGSNFYDFINNYRCREVKRLIAEDENITFLEAMYQSGFNSKSSFNKEFKKLTGTTPSEYRQSLKK
jgi:AraC-like DNA-binding protein